MIDTEQIIDMHYMTNLANNFDLVDMRYINDITI
jgi:hypothetical protein